VAAEEPEGDGDGGKDSYRDDHLDGPGLDAVRVVAGEAGEGASGHGELDGGGNKQVRPRRQRRRRRRPQP